MEPPGDLCERRVQDQLPGGRSARYARRPGPPGEAAGVELASSGEKDRRSSGGGPERGDRLGDVLAVIARALFSIQQLEDPDLLSGRSPCDRRRPIGSTNRGLTWIWRPAAAPRGEPLTVSAATRVQWRPLGPDMVGRGRLASVSRARLRPPSP